MKKNLHSLGRHSAVQFNLTAMIDVVFILITFFMLICRSIGRENYRLALPDDCATAVLADQPQANAITVSVFTPAPGRAEEIMPAPADAVTNAGASTPSILYAVRDRTYDPQTDIYRNDPYLLIESMSEHIAREAELKGDSLVYLRADKNLTYGQVQNALWALARARIKTVHLAAYRTAQPPPAVIQELK